MKYTENVVLHAFPDNTTFVPSKMTRFFNNNFLIKFSELCTNQVFLRLF